MFGPAHKLVTLDYRDTQAEEVDDHGITNHQLLTTWEKFKGNRHLLLGSTIYLTHKAFQALLREV